MRMVMIALALAAVGLPAIADDRDSSQAEVRVSRWEAHDGPSAERVYARLRRGAQRACDSNSIDRSIRRADRACADRALAATVARLDRPLLTARHETASKTGFATGF